MIFIYSENITPRLSYACHFIFGEQLGMEFNITKDIHLCNVYKGAILNYSHREFDRTTFSIRPGGILSETNIRKQDIEVFEQNGYKAFFKNKAAPDDLGFDLLSATFYLLSRYEEYLPHDKDMYGRFAHEQSLAFKNDFLHLPLINLWLDDFAQRLNRIFPQLTFRRPSFRYLPTYDIDMAWSYKHKGLIRNIGGFISHPNSERIRVLLGKQEDPFDCFEWLEDLHKKNKLSPLYFFLLAEKTGRYDKNISPHKKAMKKLIQSHAEKYDTGIHPSWKSNEAISILKKEKNILEKITGNTIKISRQHYIRLSLPETYEQLLQAGIKKDYSMGYGSINGFRASVASSFYWYNLKSNKSTSLLLYPFCFMDANAHFEQKQNTETSYKELVQYYEACKKVNGLFITIFHNYILGSEKTFDGWRDLYQEFTAQIRQ